MAQFQCRTCLEVSDGVSSCRISEVRLVGKTIKEIIQFFNPNMVSSSFISDVICTNCYQKFKTFARFIENCREIDNVLRRIKAEIGEYDDQQTALEDFDDVIPKTYSYKGNGESNGNQSSHILDDHSYFSNDKPSTKGYTITRLSTTGPQKSLQDISDKNDVDLQQERKDRLCHSCNTPLPANCSKFTIKCDKCLYKTPEVTENDTAGELITARNDIGEATMSISNDDDDNREATNDDNMPSAPEEVSEKQGLINIPLMKSIQKYEMQSHDRAISVAPVDQTFPIFLHDMKKSGIDVFQLQLRSCKTSRKRVLLIGNYVKECLECDIEFDNKKALKTHFKDKHDIDNVNCEDDNDATDLETNLDDFADVVTVKKRRRYKLHICPICKREHWTAKLLRHHLLNVHQQMRPYNCSNCHKGFLSKNALQKHSSMFQGEGCKSRKCMICLQLFNVNDYDKHVKIHRKLVCEICGDAFVTQNGLTRHKLYHGREHSTKRKRNSEGCLCPFCGKLFRLASNLRVHMKTHQVNPNQSFMCDKCPKVFRLEHQLKAHVRRVHLKTRTYQCVICSKVCSTANGLRSHEQLKHSNEQKYACKVCGDKFVRGDYYKRHMKKHTENPGKGVVTSNRTIYTKKSKLNPAICKYCSKVCKNVYVLRIHVLRHIKSIRYRCRYCSFTFSNPTNRYRHEKRHLDPDFELSCKICWKRMKTEEELDNHYEKHNQTKKYQCEFCSELLPSKYHVRHHMTENHISKEEIEMEKNEVLKEALEEYMIGN